MASGEALLEEAGASAFGCMHVHLGSWAFFNLGKGYLLMHSTGAVKRSPPVQNRSRSAALFCAMAAESLFQGVTGRF